MGKGGAGEGKGTGKQKGGKGGQWNEMGVLMFLWPLRRGGLSLAGGLSPASCQQSGVGGEGLPPGGRQQGEAPSFGCVAQCHKL